MINDIIKIAYSEEGFRILSWLLNIADAEQDMYVDQRLESFYRGRASVGKDILRELRKSPEGLEIEKRYRQAKLGKKTASPDTDIYSQTFG